MLIVLLIKRVNYIIIEQLPTSPKTIIIKKYILLIGTETRFD